MTALAFCMTKLIVRSLEAELRFYCEAFGLKVVHRVSSDEHKYPQDEVILSLTGLIGGHSLAIAQYRDIPIPPAGSVWTGFVVPDIEAALKTVERCGGKIEVGVHANPDHGVLAAIASDPEGHVIEIIQMVPAGPEETPEENHCVVAEKAARESPHRSSAYKE